MTEITHQSQNILEVRNLTKYFQVGPFFNTRQVHAVEEATFSVRHSQVLALVGESGCGKTTTLRMIARLIPVTDGEIFLESVNVLKVEPRHASLAYRNMVQLIFQDPFSSLNAVHTIEHHIERPLILHKKITNRYELHERVCTLLESVELHPAEEIACRYPHQLSGGQRQRVAIARALAVEPKLILADEPISMLDVSIRMGILNLIEKLKLEKGISFVYITHDLASARYIGDQIIVMYAGHMVEGGDSVKILGRASHPYTRLLLSAVPDPRAGLTRRKTQGVRGEVPSLIDPPPGCPFAARCPFTSRICHKSMPPRIEMAPDHWVRCHHYPNKDFTDNQLLPGGRAE